MASTDSKRDHCFLLSADGTLIDRRHGLLRVARPNDELNWHQAAARISPNISDRSCNRAR